MDDLKKAVQGFAGIAKDLPENLQVVAFQLLLQHHLDSLGAPKKAGHVQPDVEPDGASPDAKTVEESAPNQEDLVLSDIHIKARRFLEKYSVTMEELNNLFYKEAGTILPLYDDLKTTRMAEGQVRVALLQSLLHSFESGDFEAKVEDVRQECTDRKCYDSNNFTAIFKNNKSLFDFETYTKGTKTVRLSADGLKELAEVIKELQ